MAENNEKDTIDLRIIAENLGINESMICKKNWNLKLWRAIDFNRKIIMLFEELGQIIKENEDEVEEGEEGDEKMKKLKKMMKMIMKIMLKMKEIIMLIIIMPKKIISLKKMKNNKFYYLI